MGYELDTEKLVFRIVSALVDNVQEVRVKSAISRLAFWRGGLD
jgi:hypothetical protein